jgi:hypothetical protein
VIAVLTSIGVAALLAALETEAIAPLVGASAIAVMMEFIAIKAGLTALSQSAFAFGNSLTANLGLSGGGPQSMVGSAAQVALGAATGGASLAVGLAAAGAGAGLLAAGSRQEGTARGGALSIAGGALVGRSPLRGAGLALGTLAMGRGEGGEDVGLGQALADSSTVEAGLMGMSAASGSPMGMFLAMNRLRQQRSAAGRQAPPAAQPATSGPDPAPAPRVHGATQDGRQMPASPPGPDWTDPARPDQAGQQPHPYRPAPNSPWRHIIAAAAARHGNDWVDAVAERTRQVREGYGHQGLNPAQVAANFAGPRGGPDLDSPGGREVLRGLPETVRGALNNAQARAGAQAIVADVVTPRVTQDRQAIAQAVALAVTRPRAGGTRHTQQDPALDVAAALSARPEELGGYYAPVGRFVGLARRQGLEGKVARQVVEGAAGGRRVDRGVVETLRQAGVADAEALNLIRAAQLLPERLETVAGPAAAPLAAARPGSRSTGPQPRVDGTQAPGSRDNADEGSEQ